MTNIDDIKERLNRRIDDGDITDEQLDWIVSQGVRVDKLMKGVTSGVSIDRFNEVMDASQKQSEDGQGEMELSGALAMMVLIRTLKSMGVDDPTGALATTDGYINIGYLIIAFERYHQTMKEKENA